MYRLSNHVGQICLQLRLFLIVFTAHRASFATAPAEPLVQEWNLCFCLCSAYVECINGGIFEWDTVTNELVHFFANVTGYLTASLGDDWIVAADSGTNSAVLIQPQG